MRIYEFSKKFDVAVKDIVELLKERGVRRADAEFMLTDSHISFLKKRFHIGAVKEPVQTAHVNVDIEDKEVSLGDLAQRLGRPASEVIVLLLKRGIVANINKLLPRDVLAIVAKEYGATLVDTVKDTVNKSNVVKESLQKEQVVQEKRDPVVVIVGHVDHGKTTLLDYIRKTKVALGEAGGITQHLGAYSVPTNHGNVVFLDTPGHEAFSVMRERGVSVADVVALVVAADDGVRPQTIESIKAAQSLKAPIVVVINKIDKVDSLRIETVKRELSQYGLLSDEWGGETPYALISAKTGAGVDELIELLALQADMLDLVTSSAVAARGYVLESQIQKGRGAVASLLLHCGTLSVGDFFICGKVDGRVNSIVDGTGKSLKSVGPSKPVLVSGFYDFPKAGDLLQASSQKEVKKHQSEVEKDVQVKQLYDASQAAINVIVKVGSFSSLDAVVQSLQAITVNRALPIRVISSGVGDINERDIEFAEQAHALIYGLDVKVERNAAALKSEVQVNIYNIIYKLLDDAREAVLKTKKPEYIETQLGKAIVKAIFKVNSSIIAGAGVHEGALKKGQFVAIYRNSKKIGEGIIKSLQKDKRAVDTAPEGFDCAFRIDTFESWKMGDEVICFSREEKKD
ncbi:translation initiation factor IF-2 [Candidatus Chromulinivorax destructor]|uniref:Translation initiation factor IF-2 n=1 Tax=Candidatus Chromulinivorax destructor TaxID=2066483 RepID=A0A345ZBT8_9BACT|nr:translation initiation factor IF-2 [Candidatus Chromulinivorax destructor]AXK60755.1 translation initiation factor IF-2 [Candidatus Chromulinivorax destructor]